MLLFSLFLTFIAVHSAPINSPPFKTPVADPALYHPFLRRDLPQCPDPDNDRTTSGILWSCLATIFACTWSAVHPNLSGPRDSGFQRLRRQVITMICAIIAPELMAVWAMRQRLAAERLKKEFNDRFHDDIPREGWTLTHGFFIQMGGFMVCHNGKPVKVLTFKRMLASIQKGEIDIPVIHEKDIADKNKGDFLTKLLVVGQTTWFVVQCVTRWCLRLPLAELEVLTLAFAALNGIIYWIWWAKPQGVQEPIGLPLKPTASPSLHRETSFDASTDDPEPKLSQPMDIPTPNDPATATRDEAVASGDNPEPAEVNLDTTNLNTSSTAVFFFALSPYLLVRNLIKLAQAIRCRSRHRAEFFIVGRSRVPMFYADDLMQGNMNGLAIIPSIGIGIISGAFHLTLWSSSTFPTFLSHELWKWSALFVTVAPALALVLLPMVSSRSPKIVKTLAAAVYQTSMMLYIVARCVLIYLSFSTILDLPKGVLRDVQWVNLIPHVN
ncbi:hypothetical protein P691DRAFT_738804 [Macrolepiota fuliginosa MF-IS2]|uniref:Uncharacterized protein n=1 Tax=Macrolepiota fuliginosa MF-IS2 TaxID=1400762 RepID=A0A9P5X3B3_9AGAR|nr:hypothetical protein P691DRAFT_738804 [Macrolepiota fuliginosa MF-IS2]